MWLFVYLLSIPYPVFIEVILAEAVGVPSILVLPVARFGLPPIEHIDGRVLDKSPEHEQEAGRHPHVNTWQGEMLRS